MQENEMIAATQADRDTAAILAIDLGADTREFDRIVAGEWDCHAAVQAVAETRQQAENAMRERCAAICLAAKYGDIAHDAETESHDDCCEALYTAIRAASLSKEGE